MQTRNLYARCKAFCLQSEALKPSEQWQPVTVGTSAQHDPNPPITIDTYVPPPSGTLLLRMSMGMGS